MNFNKHSELRGLHAFLSPSKCHWINYDDEKFDNTYMNFLAVQNGTELHELAYRCIKKRIKLQPIQNALNLYVNDAISFRMIPEQTLVYSVNAFGTADAIAFRDNFLRIHDLKTGESPVTMNQLRVYTALFCLEYDQHPKKIGAELRIYQKTNVLVETPDPDEILRIMGKIVQFDRRIESLKEEAQWEN